MNLNSDITNVKRVNILENSEKIVCNFNYITVPCAGAIDPEIEQKTFNFNDNMKLSEFVFCPRGNGNFSIRCYEALLSGSIPIILKSDSELPFNRYIDCIKLLTKALVLKTPRFHYLV